MRPRRRRRSSRAFFSVQPGDHQVGAGGDDARADRRDLRGALALAEDHLGHAAAERAMLVDLGEAEILEGQMAQALERRGGAKPAGRDLLQEPAQTLLGHRKCSWVIAGSPRACSVSSGRAGVIRISRTARASARTTVSVASPALSCSPGRGI